MSNDHPSGSVACTARAGRMMRFVIDAPVPPEVSFFAPDAPAFTRDPALRIERAGDRFSLRAGSTVVLEGSARKEPFLVDVDVGDAEIVGFGAANGAPTRNGARFRVMTLDTLFFGIEGSSYTAFPFFIARTKERAVGVLVATTFPLDAEVKDGHVRLRGACDTEGAPVDVIVFTGTAREIVQDLCALVGRTFLPPAWALGFHQSRWSYKTEDVVLDVARTFRKHELPADVVHLDIHYMDSYRVFTFSPERFGNAKKLHDDLAALGFRTMAIVDPGVSKAPGYGVYDACVANDLLLKRKDGTAYEGKVWPGATVFPDFTVDRVQDAWGAFHQPLLDAGVAGFWNDMNDPVLKGGEVYDPLLEDVRHAGGSHARLRNTYANGMATATVRGLKKLRPGVRPFVLTRSGALGIQRHAAVWTGDNHSSWAHLNENVHMAVNLGLCGVPLVGADVGGFGRGPGKYGAVKPLRPPAELFVRWMELGSLMPFFRVHCTLYAPRQEPWSFGRAALDVSRRILRRRYRMLPLLYRLALEAHETGLPIVRPVWMHHSDVVPPDQLLLGDAVLAAPVLTKGARTRVVRLPSGASWIDFHTGIAHKGGATVVVDAPLGRTPLFVRAGAALFFAEPRKNAEDTLRAGLALEITAPPAGEKGKGSLFLDDGHSSEGGRYVLDVEVEDLGGKLRVRFTPTTATFTPAQHDLELRAPRAFASAVVDGERRALVQRDLADEDRPHAVAAVRVPLAAREIVLE